MGSLPSLHRPQHIAQISLPPQPWTAQSRHLHIEPYAAVWSVRPDIRRKREIYGSLNLRPAHQNCFVGAAHMFNRNRRGDRCVCAMGLSGDKVFVHVSSNNEVNCALCVSATINPASGTSTTDIISGKSPAKSFTTAMGAMGFFAPWNMITGV